jgi:hypothetical protein
VDFIYLEVDGSLANPYALAAVLVWTALFAGLTFFIVRRQSGPMPRRAVLVGLVALAVTTPIWQFVIGNILYRIEDSSIVSVGFWGGPPNWIAPLAAVMAAVAARRPTSAGQNSAAG